MCWEGWLRRVWTVVYRISCSIGSLWFGAHTTERRQTVKAARQIDYLSEEQCVLPQEQVHARPITGILWDSDASLCVRMEPTSLLLRDRSWSWTPRRLYSPRDRLSCTTSTSQSHMRISCASRWIDASKEFGYQKKALGFRIRRPWRPTNHCRMHHDGVPCP